MDPDAGIEGLQFKQTSGWHFRTVVSSTTVLKREAIHQAFVGAFQVPPR